MPETVVPLPTRLSASRVSTYMTCPLKFYYENVAKLPTKPRPLTVGGTLVHSALELLFGHEPDERTLEQGIACLDEAWDEMRYGDREYLGLRMPVTDEDDFRSAAEAAVRNYFRLEDPKAINAIGVELRLESTTSIEGITCSGIIDRLDEKDGETAVRDYKSGKAPSAQYAESKLLGLKFYVMLCEDIFGQRPTDASLLHLKGPNPVEIHMQPTDQKMRAFRTKLAAIWDAIQTAHDHNDWKPRVNFLCENYCDFKSRCPAFGGDSVHAPERTET